VTVHAGGNTVLSDINLRIPAGQHVAIIGSSGAGKSTLVSLLLGWHRPSQGRILCEGEELSEQLLPHLRERTAWVDPSVQLFNRSLYDNLLFGSREAAGFVDDALTDATLQELSQRLPEGLRTVLGEGGGRLSGGEAQRVRLARALLKTNPGLVICDEPFRGLDRRQRSELMASARRKWSLSTLLCVTHDIGETRAFPRVLVIEGGRIVEDGAPRELAQRANSHYAKLLIAERDFAASLHTRAWRRLRLSGGSLEEKCARVRATTTDEFRSGEADVAQ
jgi:ABC-type multidrug transport system fused ATPase/permease subunit